MSKEQLRPPARTQQWMTPPEVPYFRPHVPCPNPIRITRLARTSTDGRGRADRLSVGFQKEKSRVRGLLQTAVEQGLAETEGFDLTVQKVVHLRP